MDAQDNLKYLSFLRVHRKKVRDAAIEHRPYRVTDAQRILSTRLIHEHGNGYILIIDRCPRPRCRTDGRGIGSDSPAVAGHLVATGPAEPV